MQIIFKIGIFFLFICSYTGAFSQVSDYSEYKQKEEIIVKDINPKLVDFLKEIYGDYFNEYILANPSMLEFYTDFYNRCEFISLKECPEFNPPNFVGLPLIDKYNPSISHETEYFNINLEEFNFLKYHFNYYNPQTVYYKVYKMDVVVKINPFVK